MENQTCAVILAGGEGKRMRSNRPKVLAEVLFQPLLKWVIDAARGAGIEDICVVTGSKREYVEDYLKTLPFTVETVFQAERLGTSMGKTLVNQADNMRERRRQRAKAAALKAPIKMLFPLVLFIFPAMFVVILVCEKKLIEV